MSNKKFAIIGYPHSLNIGDEIQSLGAAGLLPRVDVYVPRERTDQVIGNPKSLSLLCNGFFMYEAEHWPPSEAIDPLFISLHVSTQHGADKLMIRPDLKPYYEAHGPLGCRDRQTMRMFRNIGVDAYYSGCITLTLDNKFTEKDRTDEILLVDPFYKVIGEEYRNYLSEWLIPASLHHRTHSITHALSEDHGMTESEKFNYAQSLLDRYARASLVVTSRIHCALPCLAMETPVLFVNAGYDNKAYGRERFDGIVELFNTIEPQELPFWGDGIFNRLVRKFRLYRFFADKKRPVDYDNPPINKKGYLAIAAEIRQRVAKWVES